MTENELEEMKPWHEELDADVYWFRAGYWCGKYIEKEDIDGKNDRGQEDVQVRP